MGVIESVRWASPKPDREAHRAEEELGMAAPDCRDARARFIELRAAGNTLADIADELGENLATVSDWAKQLDDTVASRKKGTTSGSRESRM